MPPPPAISTPRTAAERIAGPAPLRRSRPPQAPRLQWRRAVNYLLLFATVVLVVDALIGEKGFMDTLRVRREWHALTRSVEELRQENAGLVEQVRRLREDPATLESIARKEHGLIRPGEILFIVKDVKPGK